MNGTKWKPRVLSPLRVLNEVDLVPLACKDDLVGAWLSAVL